MDVIIQNQAQLEYVQRFLSSAKNMDLRQFVSFNKGVLSFPDAATQDLLNFFHAEAPESNALRNLSRQIAAETGGQVSNPYSAAAVNQARAAGQLAPVDIARAADAASAEQLGVANEAKLAKVLKGAAPDASPAERQAIVKQLQQQVAALSPESRGPTAIGEGSVASRLAAADQAIGMTPQTRELGALGRAGVLAPDEATPQMIRSLTQRGVLSAPTAELVPGLGSSTPSLSAPAARDALSAGRSFDPQAWAQGAFSQVDDAAARVLSTPAAQAESAAARVPGTALELWRAPAAATQAVKGIGELAPALGEAGFGPAAISQNAARAQLGKVGIDTGGFLSKFLSKRPVASMAVKFASPAESAAMQSLIGGGDLAAAKLAAEGAGRASLFGAGGALGPASIGRGIGYGLAGQLASSGLRGILGGERDGTWDNAATDALAWGGTGAAIGSGFGPVGTLVGGLGGLALGGLKGYFTGEDSQAKQIRDYLGSLKANSGNAGNLFDQLTMMGLSAQSAGQVIAQIGTLAQGAKSKKEVEALVQQILPNAPALAQQEAAYRQAERQRNIDSAYFQKNIMPQFQTSLDRYRDDASNYAATMQALVPSYKNQDLGKIYAAQASRAPMVADQYIAAMQAQLAAYQSMAPTQSQVFYPNILGGAPAPTQMPSMVPQQQMMSSGILAPLG